MPIFYVNGQYVAAEQASLPLTDLAILRGYAVFDFLRTYNGKPFHLEEHLQRLQKSAALLQISCPWSIGNLEEIVGELLCRNNYHESNLRLLITGGESLDSITPLDNPRLIMMMTELKPFPRDWYANGVKIITSDVTRYLPGSKSTNYIKAIHALKNARAGGAIESIYVNEKGHLLEGTTSNLFGVKGDCIVTPESDILPGITRNVVLQLAKKKYQVKKGVIARDELSEFTEFFITSSNKEVVPVIQIDGLQISKKPGPVTMAIMELFRHYTENWQ